ncbi:GGDEF domain-containing protein [Kitasatospora herbaricolor]|uniref:GGDEF domain-containing protein n=1 Tax=Kitasatospora herbaricolor TaxID=68217 RepID=UPI0036DA8BC7
MSPDIDNVLAAARSRLQHNGTDLAARHTWEGLVDLADTLQGKVTALQAKVADLTQCLDEARHDPLTGLPTRAAFTTAANAVITAHPNVLVVMLDADGLKRANDAYGHEFGDVLLQHFAARLVAWAGPDAAVGRLGGDEFAVVLSHQDGSDQEQRLIALRAGLSQPVLHAGRSLRVSASIGASRAGEGEHRSLGAALRLADQRMYEEKGRGRRGRRALPARPRVCFAHGMCRRTGFLGLTARHFHGRVLRKA